MTLNAPHNDAATPSTVILRGMDEVEYDDLPAASAIRPGMLVEPSEEEQVVRPHNEAAGAARPTFAVEYRKYGMMADESSVLPKLAGDSSVHDEYQTGDIVKFCAFDKNHRVWALLPAGESVDASAGPVPMVSNGDGMVRPADGAGGETDESSVCAAVESVDNSAGGEATRIRVEITT